MRLEWLVIVHFFFELVGTGTVHSQILLEVLTGLPSFDQHRKHTDLVGDSSDATVIH